jgi:hypothetical protein
MSKRKLTGLSLPALTSFSGCISKDSLKEGHMGFPSGAMFTGKCLECQELEMIRGVKVQKII